MRRLLIFFALAAAAAACGGKSPTASSSFDTRFVVRSARDHAPIVGAVVTVPGVGAFVSGADGVVALDPKYEDFPVEIVPPTGQFLSPRKFMYHAASLQTDTLLWPKDNQLPESQTFAVIYGSNTSNPLLLPDERSACVVLAPAITEDQSAAEAASDAVSTLQSADNDMRWGICSSAIRGAYNIEVRMDPSSTIFTATHPEAGAYAVLYADAWGSISRAEVVFKCFACFPGQHLQRAFTHELAHTRGLRDTNATIGGMMGSPSPVLDFSSWEKEAMRYAFLRPAGTHWPDDSVGVSVLSARSRSSETQIVITD